MSFSGYTDQTFEFFMALRFNNNRAFFLDNRDWYLQSVREPSLELCKELATAMQQIDPLLETRPHRVVARINRDVRFSRDKSPYRDHIWLCYRRPEQERGVSPGFYFETDAQGAYYGMGFYLPNRPLMNALRRQMRTAPAALEAIFADLSGEFSLYGEAFKRLKAPPEVPEALRDWYVRKSLYLEKRLPLARLKSAQLVQELRQGWSRLEPMYTYLQNCVPEKEDYQ